ncbi:MULTISPECIES: branched-chain amino acid ABC transporter permease [Roseovarius]|jgi:branched-subunit amino acid ABC-type transport system permease component|uniref:Branched-chain amino acid ABC transporter, permease protein n=2 Tax=Roseovarius nubinhibens TaxID=314263 RepID=A3SHN8_ROSNI|nr:MULTISPECIES: branched-chain amino acid ABC transporter permease [Roseovarius]EAP76869.1 branched-chain amino acid ABC transporter, permease protein [Roseovarius nubinhibens ISM]MAO27857.1 branched-chain amino acid ABC transporter permease [Roseovarius sp.]MAZ21769.1 branched-chain amino acid ABC transporter permease [Roseovarius sp.]MBU2998316.1 branched-chain amino acid ABC transporter permease [Roseovarius nubinhibens]HAR50936.1 branched-chain amino acid ABC transporter permease [Roseova|tara:strand:+ start:67 stop:1098 length:1032 start_codon:yes stop_codon:yes gene_type:complete
MDAILLQILNGLDKGSAYALIALGLTLIFGTLGVVNFAHGALFMIGAFCAVTLQRILTLSTITIDETQKDFLGNPLKVKTPYVESWFGPETGAAIIDWSVPLAILFAIPVMLLIGYVMERGLIKHFYKRPHADQILVTFGLAIVLQEIIKAFYGANPIPTGAPAAFRGSFDFGSMFGFDPNTIIYPYWRMVYFAFAAVIIGGVFAFLRYTTFGMVVRAGMADRETVELLGINIDRRFTIMFGVAAAVAGLAGVMYAPINSPNYHMGMDFLVLSFVVVVVGGMGSLPGAVLAGFLLGILEAFASMNEIKAIFPGIDQIIIYLVAIIIILTRPRGLMGRPGVMEE